MRVKTFEHDEEFTRTMVSVSFFHGRIIIVNAETELDVGIKSLVVLNDTAKASGRFLLRVDEATYDDVPNRDSRFHETNKQTRSSERKRCVYTRQMIAWPC